MKTTLKIASLIAALAGVAAVTVLVFGIPARVMNAVVSDRIAGATGAKIAVNGPTRVGLFPLHLSVQDVSFDTPGSEPLRVSIATTEIAITLKSLLSDTPTASVVTLTRPVLRAPLLRERGSETATARTPAPPRRLPFESLVVRDGAVVLSDPAAKVEQRADDISAQIRVAPDRRVSIEGTARLGDAPATFTAKTRLAAASDREPAPFELTFDAPSLLARRVSVAGDVKIAGASVSMSNLAGQLGQEPFNGWASVDLAGKPVLRFDLDFPRLSLDAPQWRDSRSSRWSTIPFDWVGLNYLDAQAHVSATEMRVGTLRIAPATFDLTLGSGALKLQASKLGVGGGEIDGEWVIDASGNVPDVSLRADIGNVRALPLLSVLADFDRIDGRMAAKLVLRGAGAHPEALAGSLGGTAFLAITDGEIVGINLAQMIRSLTGSTLSGWQQSPAETTDLSQFSASFRLERGQGATSDLMLAGPLVRMTGAGNIDLVTQTMAFRVEPRLVMTLQGQSAAGSSALAANLVGLGVPVVVQGPWTSPRIYPEISGMLENPDAAYAQLRKMGQGLFGPSAGGQGGIGGAIGTIIQGLGAGQKPKNALPNSDPGAPSPMNDIMKRLFGR